MRNERVRLIAAVGVSGQIGLDGLVPWHGNPEYETETRCDLNEFYHQTKGGVLVMGAVTARFLPSRVYDSQGATDRKIRVWPGRRSGVSASDFIGDLLAEFPLRTIWICGGAKTYRMFMPWVSWMHVSRISYNGPADTYFHEIKRTV